MERIGVLGGAFDPPHRGHVELARAGIEHFGLRRLLVRVVDDPGHKHVATPVADRLAMARAAFADLPGVEVAVDQHARTVDSLQELALDDPVFLIGADELASFTEWKRPERVLELAELGVGARPGTSESALTAAIERLPRSERVTVFPLREHDVSSTEIRERVARGEPVTDLVPEAVAGEIDRRGLYREGCSEADTLGPRT